MVPKCIYNCLCQVWVLCKKSHTAAVSMPFGFYCRDSARNIVWKYCFEILSQNFVSKHSLKILSRNMVTKYCLAILSQNFVWMPFGFYRPDSARNIFLSATKLNFISLLLLPLLSLHVLSPFPVVSFLSNPCTITLDPPEPRTVTVEHFAFSHKTFRDGCSSTSYSTYPNGLLRRNILKDSPTISWNIHEM